CIINAKRVSVRGADDRKVSLRDTVLVPASGPSLLPSLNGANASIGWYWYLKRWLLGYQNNEQQRAHMDS
ncbi:MAG: hypothetical protein VX346_18055, partial [Planctomycetota bacterium]|nr:hypothetical protein [Planctomycetota bacterium]